MPLKINCIIVDDDPLSVKLLEKLVEGTEFLHLVQSCNSPLEASAILNEHDIDLIFLDVEMPEMTGIEFISTLSQRPQIVLVTSKEDYAVDAFELDVTDYIIKPPQAPRFLKAVNKVLQRIESDAEEFEVKKDTLFVKVDSQLVGIKVDSIFLVEAKADYVTIHTPEKRYTVYSTMKGIVSKLPSNDFTRVHRSYIANINRIESIEDNTLVIGKKLIPVGVTYRERLMNRLNLL